MNRTEREAIVKGLTTLDDISDNLDVSQQTKQRATELYRKAIEHGDILTGRGVERTVTGCVLLASRESGEILDAEEIAAVSSDYITSKSMHRTTKLLRKELDLGFVLADPHKRVSSIAEEIGATDEEIEKAHEFIDIVLEDGVASGKKSTSIAASIFYIIAITDFENGSQGKYTQSELARAADVSEVTIRNTYRDFFEVLGEKVDEVGDTR